MRGIARLVTLAWGALAVAAFGGEAQLREGIEREVAQYLAKDDFAAYERRYAHALTSRERLPSGVFVANRLLRVLPDAARPRSGSLVAGSGADFDLRKVESDLWIAMGQRAAKWVASYPDSVLAAIAQSEFHLQHGYAFRGYGPASGVPPRDMAAFKEQVGKAFDVLNARAAQGATDPGWHYQMLRVARLQQWEPARFTDLLKRAIAIDPGQYDIYFAASEMLLPQWGGNVDTLDQFADFAARYTMDQEGESLYARIYWNVAPYFRGELFRASRADWHRMRTGFRDIVKRYPDSWNLNSFAWFACVAGDRATLGELLDRIGEAVEPEIWQTRQYYMGCRRWAGATDDRKERK